jgi:hypothetical protein
VQEMSRLNLVLFQEILELEIINIALGNEFRNTNEE